MFGPYNGLFIKVSVRAFLFDGFGICNRKDFKRGGFATKIACSQMRTRSKESRGMFLDEDHITFSYFNDVKLNSFYIHVHLIAYLLLCRKIQQLVVYMQ